MSNTGNREGRILFHAKNGGSLGHLNRVAAIAEAVLEVDQTTKVLLLTENDPRLFDQRIPFVRLPPFEGVPHSLPNSPVQVGAEAVQRLLSGAIASTLIEFRPTLVVYDTLVWSGLQKLVRSCGCAEALILRLRNDMRHYFARNRSPLRRMCRIIIPHHSLEWSHVMLPDALANRTVFVGPILRYSRNDADPAAIRRDYHLDGCRPIVVITGGGGGYTEHTSLYVSAVQAAKLALDSAPQIGRNYRIIVITGPHFHGDLGGFNSDHVLVRQFESQLFDLLSAADVVICQGGYNTLNEVVELRVPTICVPAARSHDDQFARAEALSRLHPWIRVLSAPKIEEIAVEIAALLRLSPDQREVGASVSTGTGENRLSAAALLAETAKLAPGFARFPPHAPTREGLVRSAMALRPEVFFRRW